VGTHLVISGEAGGRTTPDSDIQAPPETDPIAQGLAALEKRLAIELKVKFICCVLFTVFVSRADSFEDQIEIA